jgi:predicted Zn-dependent protease with MMP-like domain
MRISNELFIPLVEKSWRNLLRSLPDDLRNAARDITVLVENRPSEQTAEETGDDDLLGLYDGTPLAERYSGQVFNSANVICVYRIPLAESCRNLQELKEEIRITLIHELGHHLGFNEEDLIERGLE